MKYRDFDGEQFFIKDNLFVDCYTKLCGWKASVVYDCLCRHSNKQQKAWPSISTMAKESNLCTRSIIRGLKDLLDWNIIATEEVRGRHNTYILLHKTEWKDYSNQCTTVTSAPQSLVTPMQPPVHHSHYTPPTTVTPSILKKYTNKVSEELSEKEREKNLERMAILKEKVGGFRKARGGSND